MRALFISLQILFSLKIGGDMEEEFKIEIPDERFMSAAFDEALRALDNDEVPVGAVIVHNNRIIGRGYNQIEKLQDATAHAEIIAIGAAANQLETWRLNDCTLFVTLEPCMMCLGAIMQSRISRVVFGASDNRFGAMESTVYREGAELAYRRWPEIRGGLMKEESRDLIQSFFKKIREKSKENRKSAD
jgi:tRNA(adenine34) deaminase